MRALRILPEFSLRIAFCAAVAFVSATSATPTLAQHKLTAPEAKEHIGEMATVCGTVASAHFAERTRGQPTFLNLDKSYPNQIFTILIWGNHREKFGSPENRYQDKRVCVTGAIKGYRGVPEIVADEPSQIVIEK
jgi:hypothetical protein